PRRQRQRGRLAQSDLRHPGARPRQLARAGRPGCARAHHHGRGDGAVPAAPEDPVRGARSRLDGRFDRVADRDDAADAKAGGARRAEGDPAGMTRFAAVACVADRVGPDALVIACNGMIGRELFTHRDAPSQFYMIGSMGLAASIGLGLALVQPERRVVVLDGDGNVLMGMGALASVAAAAPENFYHVVFDHAAHGSTGDQRTVSDRVPLDAIARAAGYRRTERVSRPDASTLGDAIARLFEAEGPAMLLVEVERGNQPGIGRVEPSPPE